MITINQKDTPVHRIRDMDFSQSGCGSSISSVATTKSLQNKLNGGLLEQQDKKSDYLTSYTHSLEKQYSTTEKLRRELYNMKQSSFTTDDKAPSTSHVMEILFHSFQCVDKEDTKSSSYYNADIPAYGDDESLTDDFDDDLKDSIHLARKRFGARDSKASSPVSKLAEDDESLMDDFEDDLKDSVHLAKRRFGPRNLKASSPATKRRDVEDESLIDDFEDDLKDSVHIAKRRFRSKSSSPATKVRGNSESVDDFAKRRLFPSDAEASSATTKLPRDLKSIRDSVSSCPMATIAEPGSPLTVRAKAA